MALFLLHRWRAADRRGEQVAEMPLRGQWTMRQELAAAMSLLPEQQTKQQERAADNGAKQE